MRSSSILVLLCIDLDNIIDRTFSFKELLINLIFNENRCDFVIDCNQSNIFTSFLISVSSPNEISSGEVFLLSSIRDVINT